MRTLNVQQKMDGLIDECRKEGRTPTLLLHSCCAPCSSYVLEYLSEVFRITDLFYNPNITDKAEYEKREAEIKRLIETQPHKNEVVLVPGRYEPEKFFEISKGLETVPEGGERCRKCFELRLREAALKAKEYGSDYVTTTLTISPLKDADALNEIGEKVCSEAGVRWLPSDFKKKGGYQRSIELSKEYDLYRQNYCGCIFSKRDSLRRSEYDRTSPNS